MDGTSVIVAAVAVVLAIVAIALAWRAHRAAVAAAEEAGQARARAGQSGSGGVTPEALAAAERLWSTRFAALEAQVLAPGARPSPRSGNVAAVASSDLAGRVEELERSVSGLAVTLKELRRAAPNRERAAGPMPPADPIVWPSFLAGEEPGIRDVRLALAPAVTAGDPAACALLERLRQAERWPASKLEATELAAALQEISTQLLAVLRRDGSRGPLDAAMFADRVLAALRPAWKSFQPHLDCRSMLPGATLDPDWMEDRTPAGLRRPVISEMLSWAVFE
ncbi:MAG: hypothetical protein HY736_27610, partial [Verrucomicrobia bacterium]|nr:hypothetical protein [Verrucomicrobiota bacterium]